jgi:GT2 family glycosyltransferase
MAIESALDCDWSKINRVIIADDASTDSGVGDLMRKLASRSPSKFVLLRSKTNRGFGSTVNLGVSASKTPYFVIFNTDLVATPGWCEHLHEAITQKGPDFKIAIVGPRLLFPEDSTAPGCPPGKIQSCGFAFDRQLLPYHRLIGWSPDHPKALVPRLDLQGITGACWMVRRSAWNEVGGFDPSFGMYYEDVDFCMKLRAKGWLIGYEPRSVLYHRVGGSQSTPELTQKAASLMPRNAATFLQRHGAQVKYDEWAML